MKMKIITTTVFVVMIGLMANGLPASAQSSNSLMDENIAVGRVASIGLPSGTQGWNIVSNSNNTVASATVTNDQLVINGAKEGFTTIVTCDTQNTQCQTVAIHVTKTVSDPTNVLGATTVKNGQLVLSGKTLYVIYKNTKTGFANLSAFQKLGYKTNQAVTLNISDLSETGYVVTTSLAAHPWGSWVKNNGTVYFVHQLGLIPVADYPTFLNNGGSDSSVLSANKYDMALTVLPLMVTSDARLQ
jgi:hypothetical protein